jgi:hypothetical protein
VEALKEARCPSVETSRTCTSPLVAHSAQTVASEDFLTENMRVQKNCEAESGRDMPFVDRKNFTSDSLPPANSSIIRDVFRVGHPNDGGDDIFVSGHQRRKFASMKAPDGSSLILRT